ncbi:hypothetical protein Clacol_010288 [Clathrus columnatus]|uniref:WSC domain-containing protein n=1 Tax=Clathrus columnatus TaxID=1419009 RepID=A0AAV5AS82_9AGAM|nr:hypothetical protein Clacol_010288 [Clathrus columnatus]
MTIPSCIDFCISGGFDFAGVEFGRECYCDTIIHSPASIVSNATDCEVPCSGDPTTICGAALRLNIYSTPAPTSTPTQPSGPAPTVDFITGPENLEFEIQGCFADPQNPRALLHQIALPGLTTPSSCAAACAAAGFQVMGLENGSECWCDNYMPYAVSANGECNLPCNGDLSKACGGVSVIQVYGNVLNFTGFDSQQCLGGGRDSSNYFPFSFRGVTEEGDTIDLIAEQLNPDVTSDQQFILTSGTCVAPSPSCPQGFKFFQLVNNQVIPYAVLGNPVTLRAAVGESQFFTAFSSDTAFDDYCAGPGIGTNNLPFVGFPVLDQTDGTTNQWGLCHNNSANGRLDAVYSPIMNHPNYNFFDCILVQLTLLVPGASAL